MSHLSHFHPPLLPYLLFFFLIINSFSTLIFSFLLCDITMLSFSTLTHTHTHIIPVSFLPICLSSVRLSHSAVFSLLFHCVYWGLYARDGVGNSSLKILGEFCSSRRLTDWQTALEYHSLPKQNERLCDRTCVPLFRWDHVWSCVCAYS